MKKRLLIIIFILINLLSARKAKAMQIDANGNYINYNNIIITQTEFDNLTNLGFTEKEIDAMSIEEYNNNKDLQGEIVSSITKYYRTDIIYPGNNTMSMRNALPISNTIEVSEEEYNTEIQDKESIAINLNSLTNGYTETTYKKMTSTIISVNSRYRYKNTLVWKRMPSTRSYDIIGIGIDSTVSGISSTKYFSRIADIEDSVNKVCFYSTSSNATWNLTGTGYTATFLLPSNTSSQKVTSLSSYMYFEVQKLTNTTILTLNAYGSYKHSQQTVSLSGFSGGISISTGGIGFDASVSTSIQQKFDSMSTAQATWSNLKW